ncbi:MAG: VCBS repeat-containing protein [Candidatus Marinimicrobia bacterium]|nr:VCBS repeat-containing protein [Candidatus Neomarinimicrobiota bacterium]
MTIGEKIFFVILGFNFLVATAVPLEISVVPKLNCYDLNGNGNPDFIAINNSASPRTLYHIDVSSSKTKILWEYTMPESKKGYFVDFILGDFDNNGIVELIATAYQDGGNDIFYVFSTDAIGFYGGSPVITGLKNNSDINNPRKLYSMQPDAYGQSLFLLSQGSPNRQVIMCAFMEGDIMVVGSIGREYLNKTMAPIDIALGDFDGDGGEDVFILDNGFFPSGYYIYSNGKEKGENLSNYPRLRFLHEKGIDLNFDGSDDLVMVSKSGTLMSDIWGTESIPLSNENIQNIIINPDNGFIYLTSIDKMGKIRNFSLDPLTRGILSSDFETPEYAEMDYKTVTSLVTTETIVLTHNGQHPEIWTTPLATELITDTPPPIPIQRIYNRIPDFVINLGDDFSHSIHWESSATFRNFTEKYVPSGMDFDLDELKLNWTPKPEQLGYHELSYKLELREKGSRELDTDNGKIFVSQNEPLSEKPYSFLLYVNDPVTLEQEKDSVTIVNGELFEWVIPIKDKNGEAQLTVEIISGSKKATINLLNPEVILVPIDNKIEDEDVVEIVEKNIIEIEPEIVESPILEVETKIDKIEVKPEKQVYVDTVLTEFEEFAEEKLTTEKDPFKKKKQESSVEEFKTKEEEYREKLKTHTKILKDGKNIWVLKDSLSFYGDSLLIEIPEITLEDTVEIKSEEKLFTQTPMIDSLIISESIVDTAIIPIKIEETTIVESDYLEISYAELINHQAQFSWEPHVKAGDYSFIIASTDGFTSDTSSFTISVHPEINLRENKTQFTATVDQMFQTTLILNQSPRSEKFEYDLINAPENMRIDNKGAINWVPLPIQVDDYNFEIKVTDGIATSTLHYEIYVNAPPVISSRPEEIFILPLGESLAFPLESFDLNSNTVLEWKLLRGPIEMTLSPQGVLSWEGHNLGHHPYEIQLTDGIDSVQWKASIYVNSPPVFTSEPVVTVAKGERYEYPLFARDENTFSPNDSLSKNSIIFSLAQGPDGMKIDNNVLVWETGDNYLGEYIAAVTANDGAQDAIQVFPVFINSFPEITSLDSITIQAGDTLQFQIKAYDPNPEDTLTFHLDSLHHGMLLELHSGILTWSPEESDIGLHNFILQVKDGHDDTGTAIPFQIFVYTPPQLTSELSTEAFSGLEYTAFLTAEDLYGKKLSSPESIKIDSASFKYYNLSEYAHLFKWTPREVDKGSHELIIKLTDEFGFTTYHTHSLSVFTNPCVHCNNEDEEAPADSTGN